MVDGVANWSCRYRRPRPYGRTDGSHRAAITGQGLAFGQSFATNHQHGHVDVRQRTGGAGRVKPRRFIHICCRYRTIAVGLRRSNTVCLCVTGVRIASTANPNTGCQRLGWPGWHALRSADLARLQTSTGSQVSVEPHRRGTRAARIQTFSYLRRPGSKVTSMSS